MAECGECSLCCKLMRIEELNKPDGKWCQHATPGKGCGIYATRPQSCQDYKCLWLATQDTDNPMPAELRPDRSKVVLGLGGATDSDLIVRVDPGRPGHWRTLPWLVRLINRVLELKNEVIIVTGGMRTLLSPETTLDGVVARHPVLADK